MKTYKTRLKTNDIIKTKRDLFRLKRFMLPIFCNMGLSRNIYLFPIRFGKKSEFKKDTDAFYTKKYIVIKRGKTVVEILSNLAHEYGHEVTITGDIGNKSNLVGETTAYNFQRTFISNFNNITGVSIQLVSKHSFLKSLKINALYTISFMLSFIPLGLLIKRKYRR